MKKLLALLLALAMIFALAACGEAKTEAPKTEEPAAEAPAEEAKEETPAAEEPAAEAPAEEAAEEAKDYSGYTIRIYSNSNSTERVDWLAPVSPSAWTPTKSTPATPPPSRPPTRTRTET